MDEKIKDQEALLMKDSKYENLKALSGTDEKGGLKTVSPTAEHEQNFLSNFIRQFKPPHNSTSSKSSSRVLLPVHECSPRCSKHRMLPPIMPVRDKKIP